MPKRVNKPLVGDLTKPLTPKQQVFIREYLVSLNQTTAAIAAGVPKRMASSVGAQWMTRPKFAHVRAAYERLLYERNIRSEKKADDILEYIHIGLFFVPSMYFLPGGNGGWLIDEENYKKLPVEIGRLIEEVESRVREVVTPDGTTIRKTMFWVRFISKTEMTKLAFKYHLGEKVHVDVNARVMNWHEMHVRPQTSEAQTIEGKIKGALTVEKNGSHRSH